MEVYRLINLIILIVTGQFYETSQFSTEKKDSIQSKFFLSVTEMKPAVSVSKKVD